MSFLAKLELDDKTYNVLECEYDFTQNIDETGKPKGMPYGGEISIRVESTGTPELLTPALYTSKPIRSQTHLCPSLSYEQRL